GPFRLNDMTGVDLAFIVLRERYKKTGVKEPGYDMFEKMYEEGRWGVKTGKGFYDYTDK
ncbi:MAG: 3-hydroxyacyl-CoA dehydrogenase family protein, partial [Lachnospiraceae bacterium]|nr:3-hydroxyacyl-CoA dehydrogenase family protein [Lachnospiraceae bacterium]